MHLSTRLNNMITDIIIICYAQAPFFFWFAISWINDRNAFVDYQEGKYNEDSLFAAGTFKWFEYRFQSRIG